MAITFTLNDAVDNDQTTGIQTTVEAAPKHTDTDVSFVSLNGGDSLAFYNRLTVLANAGDIAFATDVGAAKKVNSVTVNASANGDLSGIKFTGAVDDNGTPGDPSDDTVADLVVYDGLDPTLGGATGLQTVDGDAIYLFKDATLGDTMVLGYDATGDLVFSVFMVPKISADGSSATVDFYLVTFEPIMHTVDGNNTLGEHDDEVDLADFLSISASESIIFSFDGTPAGKNLFTIVLADTSDPTGSAVVVTPYTEVIELNTSKGGGPTTLALFNQMIDPNEKMVFTFVFNPNANFTVPNLDQNEADDENNIKFGSLQTIQGGSVIISQTQGPGPHALRLAAWDAIGTTEVNTGDGFINGYTDDDPAAITFISVRIGTTTHTWTSGESGATKGGVKVTFNGDGSVDVDGFKSDYVIGYSAGDHERITVTGLKGKFDIGGIGIDQEEGNFTSVGHNVVMDDDGPTASIVLTGEDVTHDESPGLQTLANGDQSIPGVEDDNDDDKAGDPPAAIVAFETAVNGDADPNNNVTRIGWAQSTGSGPGFAPAAVVSTASSAFGTDGGGTKTLSLVLSAAGADSGIDTTTGGNVLLYKEGDLVVGRVDGPAGPVAFIVYMDQAGVVSVAQYLALFNPVITNPDDPIQIANGVLFARVDVSDIEGDTATNQVDIGAKVRFEDVSPTASQQSLPQIEEDDLRPAAGSNSTGIDEDGSVVANPRGNVPAGNHILKFDFGATVQAGVDVPASFSIKLDAAALAALTGQNLKSKGAALAYDLAVDNKGTASLLDDVYTLTGFVDTGPAGLDGGDRKVFTWELVGDGKSTYTQIDQFDHAFEAVPAAVDNTNTAAPGDTHALGENALTVDLSNNMVIKDVEGDPVSQTLLAEIARYTIIDDIPDIGAVAGGVVDFLAGQSVTKTLNGLIGSDENGGAGGDTTRAGGKTYTFTFPTDQNGDTLKNAQDTIVSTSIAGLTAVLSADGTKIEYFAESNGTGGFQADEKFFDIVLGNQSGAGNYTFTVYKGAPPAFTPFDFTDLPSGQNLHGTIAVNKADLTKGGLLVMPVGAIINDPGDGTFTNDSPTTNTSKGGGPVTIGNGNQMIDPGEGFYFTYVDSPTNGSVGGLGLTQTTADDADTVKFTGTNPVTKAQVEIVQVQGGGLASMTIDAYDVVFDDASINTDAESRAYVKNPLIDTVATGVAVQKEITEVKVFNSAGAVVFHDLQNDGLAPLVNTAAVTVNFAGNGVAVGGIDQGYTIEFTTNGDHDLAKIVGTGGKFDIGGFNLLQIDETPDQLFRYAVDINDFDGDKDTSGNWDVLVDGTGKYDDGVFDNTV